jgi:ABC-type transporter Mla subunit MlaD
MTNLNDALTAINDATNNLNDHMATLSEEARDTATRVAAVEGKLSTSMSADEVAAAKTTLSNEATRLNQISAGLDTIGAALVGIAADPAQPVPPQPEPPVVSDVPATDQPTDVANS